VLVFVRTKLATAELAERLEARGHLAAALSGDVVQKQREAIVQRLKSGGLDIVVATDVAARGLDVERISHVINYDMPYDPEAYIHRIGRTGRAGRAGEAILFLTPRERRMLQVIERATRHRIEEMHLPSAETIADARISRFHDAISETLASADLEASRQVIEGYLAEHEVEPAELAAALAEMLRGEGAPVEDIPVPREPRPERAAGHGPGRGAPGERERPGRGRRPAPDAAMETYRLDVGTAHGAKPGNILGAIANETGLAGSDIGKIRMFDEHSTVDLPEGMPKAMFQHLRKVRVVSRPLKIELLKDAPEED